jgi:hypothetical protein
MRAVVTVVAFVAVPLVVAGCSPGRTSATLTSPSAMASPGSEASSGVTFVVDSDVNGSEYVLTSLDTATRLLTFSGSKGVFTAVLNASTVFRAAQLDRFDPRIPAERLPKATLRPARSPTKAGCSAPSRPSRPKGATRVEKHTVPPDPVRSFRPLASF